MLELYTRQDKYRDETRTILKGEVSCHRINTELISSLLYLKFTPYAKNESKLLIFKKDYRKVDLSGTKAAMRNLTRYWIVHTQCTRKR